MVTEAPWKNYTLKKAFSPTAQPVQQPAPVTEQSSQQTTQWQMPGLYLAQQSTQIQPRIAGPIPESPRLATKTTPLAPGFEEQYQVPTVKLTPTKDVAYVAGESLQKLPQQIASSALQAWQGEDGASVVNRDWADKYVQLAQQDINQFAEQVKWQYPDETGLVELARLSETMGFSLTAMGPGVLASLPLWLAPEPTMVTKSGAMAITGAVSGVISYRMATYQIVQEYLEFRDAEKRASTGQGLTLEEENQLKADFHDKAVQYGLWEAIPEGISNMLFSGLMGNAFSGALNKVVGQTAASQIASSLGMKIVTKAGAIYGEELVTETITQKGQAGIEYEVGLREGNIGWWEALKEIAPQTFLLTTVMAGAGQTIISTSKAVSRIKNSLKSELGEDHAMYDILIEGVESEFETITGVPAALSTGEVVSGRPRPTDAENQLNWLKTQLARAEAQLERTTMFPLKEETSEILAQQRNIADLKRQIANLKEPTVTGGEVTTTAMAAWGEAGGLEEFLSSDPIATYTVHVGGRKVHLDYFLKNGDWPESFTVKEAAALMQKPVEFVQSKIKKGGIATDRVESAYVLDELAEQFGTTEEGFIQRLREVYKARRELQYQQAYGEIPQAAEGQLEAGLQADIFGKTTPVQPKAKGVPVTESMEAYQKLQEMKGEAAKPTAPAVEPTAKPVVPERQLRKRIHSTAKQKGLSENRVREIAGRVTGIRKLTNMTVPQLTDLLKAVERARPLQVGSKKVITRKTEQEIQTVKQALIKEGKLTQADYDSILRLLKLPTDKYTDRTSFITETQGRRIVKAMKRKSRLGWAFTEERTAELISNLKPPKPPSRVITGEDAKDPLGARFKDKMKSFSLRTFRMERLLGALDKFKDTGLWQNTFYRTINEATDARIAEKQEWQDNLLRFAKQNRIKLGQIFTRKTDFGNGVVLTGEKKIGVYLSSLNKDNLRHLREGNKFSDDLIIRVVNKLTREERLVAEFLQDYFQQSGVPVASVYKYLTDQELELVENYFPIVIDKKADPYIDFWELLMKDDAQGFVAEWASSKIPKPFTYKRTHEAGQAIDLRALSIWWNHLELTSHYKNFAPIINDLQLIMKNPEFKTALVRTQGQQFYQVLDQWVKDVADVSPLRVHRHGEQMMRTLRVNAVTAVLGVNITTALKQFPSWVSAISMMGGTKGTVPAIRGLMEFSARPRYWRGIIKQLSPQIHARTMERELAEARAKKNIERRITQKLSTQEVFMVLTTTMDKYAVSSIWVAGYLQYLKKNPNANAKEAAQYAESIIRKTQPFFAVKDLAEYYRSGEFMKVLTVFTNQLNQYWNMANFEIMGKFRAKPGPKAFVEMVDKTIWGLVLPAYLIGLIIRAKLPEDKEEVVDDLKDDVGRTALSMIPLMGHWLSAGYEGWRDGQGLISTEVFEQFQRAVYNMREQEWKEVGLQVPELLGYVKGIPVAQPKRTVTGILELLQGETEDWRRLIWSQWTIDKPFRDLIDSWDKTFDTYYDQPAPRYDYRAANPEIDARLFVASKVTTFQSDQARSIAMQLIQKHNIDVRRISGYEKQFGAGIPSYPGGGTTSEETTGGWATEAPPWENYASGGGTTSGTSGEAPWKDYASK